MDLQQLRYVAALADEKHFQKAAQRAHISQPTLSQQIMKLEKELGVTLFERSPRRVRLTPEGEKFLPHALSVLKTLENAVAEAGRGAKEVGGRIRVGAIPTIGPYLLPPVLRRLRREAPRLALELYELTTSMLLEHLKEGKVDLGLLALPIQDKGIVGRSLGEETFRLAVAEEHPLAAKRRANPKHLLKERMLILQEGHCFRNQALAFCKMSAQDPQVIFQGSSLVSVLKLAAAGEGLTLVPRMAANPRENPGLKFLPFEAPEPSREVGVVWRVTAPLARGHHVFMDAVEKELKKILAA